MTLLGRLRPVHLALLVPWVAVVIAARSPLRDNSFLWHVAAGRGQIDAGAVFTIDPFSFTFGGDPWRTQSWLVELFYGWCDQANGLAFVPFMVAGVGITALAAVVLAAFNRGASPFGVALIAAGGSWLAAAFLSPRPSLFGYLCLAMVVVATGSNRTRWALPLILWVWAGVHASFVLGILYVGAEGLRHRRPLRHLAVEALAICTPVLLTAHGFGVVEVLVDFVRAQAALEYLTEWRTPDLLSLPLLPATFVLFGVLVLAVKGGLALDDMWVLVPGLALMLSATRSVFPAFLFLMPVVAAGFGRLRPGQSQAPGNGSRTETPMVGLLALILLIPLVIPSDSSIDETRFPTVAAEHLTGDRIFTDDVSAGYLIYRMWPQRRVFVDDRAELYGADFYADLVATRRGTPTWQSTFREWGIDQALVRVEEGVWEAARDAGWVEVHRDDSFVVLEPGS